MNENFLDGNVVAGPLIDVFQSDVAVMRGECASCRDVAALAQSIVYGPPMGFVMRCSKCGEILAVLVEAAGRRLLALDGLRWIDVSS